MASTLQHSSRRQREGTNYYKYANTPSARKVKREQRKRVLRFTGDNHTDRPLVGMEMPGTHWAFSHMLDNELGPDNGAFFIGGERSLAVMDKATRYMPGEKRRRLALSGNGLLVEGRVSTRAITILGEVEYLPWKRRNLPDTDLVPPPFRDIWGPMTWRERMSNWTAIWLDLCGPLANWPIYTLMQDLPQMLQPGIVVPLTVTGQFGRDQSLPAFAVRSHEGRAELLKAELESSGAISAEIMDTWGYRGGGGSNMVTCCFLLKPKKKSR